MKRRNFFSRLVLGAAALPVLGEIVPVKEEFVDFPINMKKEFSFYQLPDEALVDGTSWSRPMIDWLPPDEQTWSKYLLENKEKYNCEFIEIEA